MRQIIYLIGLCFSITACTTTPSPKKDTQAKTPDSLQYGCCAPDVLDKTWYTSGKKAPFISGLEGIEFPITTKNPEAQQYFNQGLMLAFGFNHAEAGRSFFEAARQDSTCAICWWGYAYVLGPNYNAGMEPDNYSRAYEAVQKAKVLSASTTPKEKALVDAMAHRYSNDTTMTRAMLDSTYAVAMRSVYKKFPNDVTIATLFAESLMDLHPWNLWQKDGTVQPWTPEITDVLEKALTIDPRHAGANHLYIHATEMSQHAEIALPSAELLRDLVPGSGHLEHMPSHTYIRIGRYHDGAVANQKAVLVDSMYTVACHAQGVYPLAYYPHNFHFMSACATLAGESKLAMEGANETANHAHQKLLREPAWATLQHYYSIPWFVQVKLGLFDDILNCPPPDDDLKYPLAVWHYAQGMAALSKNYPEEAHKHSDAIKIILTDESIQEMTIWGINSVLDICYIASYTLEGEIKAKEKNYTEAIKLLKEAVDREDALNYDEPPDWFFSLRHHLGAVLVEAGKYKEAIAVYEEDLKVFRLNGWALIGLMNAYEKSGDTKKYNETKVHFDEAWKYADIKINTSRIL
jgi:tetratricopeptide (TPR) repeat protein